MVFKDEFVESTTTPKTPNSLPYSELDKYYFRNNILFIVDLTYNITLLHTYKISEQTLILASTLTRNDLMKMIETEGIINGIDYYTEIINSIPANFSGNINYTLKR